jgi:hypothetical protein
VLFRKIAAAYAEDQMKHEYSILFEHNVDLMDDRGSKTFTLEQATKTQRGVEFFCFFWALDGGGWSTPRPGRFTPGNDLVPIV